MPDLEPSRGVQEYTLGETEGPQGNTTLIALAGTSKTFEHRANGTYLYNVRGCESQCGQYNN